MNISKIVYMKNVENVPSLYGVIKGDPIRGKYYISTTLRFPESSITQSLNQRDIVVVMEMCSIDIDTDLAYRLFPNHMINGILNIDNISDSRLVSGIAYALENYKLTIEGKFYIDENENVVVNDVKLTSERYINIDYYSYDNYYRMYRERCY